MPTRPAFCSTVFVAILGCGGASEPLRTDAEIVSVLHEDSGPALPPPEPRTYRTKVSAGLYERTTLDATNRVLSVAKRPLTSGEFRRVVRAVHAARLRRHARETADDGCVGGTTESIEIVLGGGGRFEGYQSSCGDQAWGTLDGDIGAVRRVLDHLGRTATVETPATRPAE